MEVRDRTGAGDAFAGAMIAALMRKTPLTDAVVAANAAGSAAVSRLGAVGEVEVAAFGASSRTLGTAFLQQVAASRAGQAADEPGR